MSSETPADVPPRPAEPAAASPSAGEPGRPAGSPSAPATAAPPEAPGGGALRPGPLAATAARQVELLWYRLAMLRWRALALVAPGRPELATRLMQRLVTAVGGPGNPVLHGVDASTGSPRRIETICRVLDRAAKRGNRERVLVAAPDPASMPEARELILTCDITLLVLLGGESRLEEVRGAMALVDRRRVLGAVFTHELRAA